MSGLFAEDVGEDGTGKHWWGDNSFPKKKEESLEMLKLVKT